MHRTAFCYSAAKERVPVIEVITPGDHQANKPVIESMYKMRYRALVERCGWRIPDLDGERDCDAYDTEDTIYFVERAPDADDVVACARLNPTVKPHMLKDLFAGYCDLQGVLTGETIYEASRIAIDCERLDAVERREAIWRLEWTATKFALMNGIQKLTWFVSEKVYVHNIQLWSTLPLGLPAHFEDDGRTYIPAISTIDEAALQRLAARASLYEASMQRNGVRAEGLDTYRRNCAKALGATVIDGARRIANRLRNGRAWQASWNRKGR